MSSRKLKKKDSVLSEAIRWFNRFRMKGPTALSPDESADWARWSANKTHLAEFRRTEELWEKLQHLSKSACPSQQDLEADEYDSSLPVSEWLKTRR